MDTVILLFVVTIFVLALLRLVRPLRRFSLAPISKHHRDVFWSVAIAMFFAMLATICVYPAIIDSSDQPNYPGAIVYAVLAVFCSLATLRPGSLPGVTALGVSTANSRFIASLVMLAFVVLGIAEGFPFLFGLSHEREAPFAELLVVFLLARQYFGTPRTANSNEDWQELADRGEIYRATKAYKRACDVSLIDAKKAVEAYLSKAESEQLPANNNE